MLSLNLPKRKNDEGLVVGIECASEVRLGRLSERLAQLHSCLPSGGSYLIVVFPPSTSEQVKKAIKLVNEVWVTGESGLVEQMMFMSVVHKG